LLFTIDPKPFVLAVQKAKAQLNNTEQQIKVEIGAVLIYYREWKKIKVREVV